MQKKYLNNGLEIMDLIEEGNIGLLKAVDKFDVTRKNRFSTYATWWIRRAITRAIMEKGRNRKIPAHVYQNVLKYKRTFSLLEERLKREPTSLEISQEMNLTVSDVGQLYQLQFDTISTNMFVGEDETSELEEYIPSNDDLIEDEVIHQSLSSDIQELFLNCNLSSREIEVLTMLYGFYGNDPMTLQSVADNYGITKERVRQIEAQALKKIRSSEYISSFAQYMNNPSEAIQSIEKYKNYYDINSKSKKAFKK